MRKLIAAINVFGVHVDGGIMEFGRIAGGQIIAMDVNDTGLNFCKDKLKVQHTINPLNEDVLERRKILIMCMRNKLVDPATYITHRVQFDEVKDNL